MRIKNYLSYSQFDTYRRSPALYERIYINGQKRHSKHMDFGKKIAEALKRGEGADLDEKLAISLIPLAQEHEVEMMAQIEDVPMKGYLDALSIGESLAIIDEHKTGTVPWDQARVDNADQLTIYAILVNKVLSIPLDEIKIRLSYLPTYEDTDGKIHLVGEIKTFETERTMKHIINIYPQIEEVWYGIEKLIEKVCQ